MSRRTSKAVRFNELRRLLELRNVARYYQILEYKDFSHRCASRAKDAWLLLNTRQHCRICSLVILTHDGIFHQSSQSVRVESVFWIFVQGFEHVAGNCRLFDTHSSCNCFSIEPFRMPQRPVRLSATPATSLSATHQASACRGVAPIDALRTGLPNLVPDTAEVAVVAEVGARTAGALLPCCVLYFDSPFAVTCKSCSRVSKSMVNWPTSA